MENTEAEAIRNQVESRMKSGANWYFWIAGLSLVNTIMQLGGANRRFVVGLGVTEIIGAIAQEIANNGGENARTVAFTLAVVFDLIAAGVVVVFGVFARKRHAWAFIVGMVLYGLDGLLFLLVQDWLSLGFHAFALYCLFLGLKASRQLGIMDAAAQAQAVAPPPPPATT